MSAKQMTTPDRSTAAAFPRYLTGEVVADSVALQWPGLYARRWRHPRVVDRFLVLAKRSSSQADAVGRNGRAVRLKKFGLAMSRGSRPERSTGTARHRQPR